MEKGVTLSSQASDVGKKCHVEGIADVGTVKFVGKHHESGKGRVGVKFAKPVGKMDGTLKEHTYFKCKPNHGVLVAKSKVTLLTEGEPGYLEVGAAD